MRINVVLIPATLAACKLPPQENTRRPNTVFASTKEHTAITMIKNTASIGIFPNNIKDVTFLYPSEIPVIGFPFEVNSASPRTAVIVPSVMMNGGKFPTATPTPFTIPTPSPARQATMNGTISGRFPCPNIAARIPVNAMIDPTDISNPPQMITNIIPNERIPTMDVCFKMFTILPPDKKL